MFENSISAMGPSQFRDLRNNSSEKESSHHDSKFAKNGRKDASGIQKSFPNKHAHR